MTVVPSNVLCKQLVGCKHKDEEVEKLVAWFHWFMLHVCVEILHLGPQNVQYYIVIKFF